jgi:exodeoxyribonuclease VII large subunit
MERQCPQRLHDFELKMAAIERLSPMAVLSHGYSITQKNGLAVTSSKALKSGDEITITFADGKKEARII